jgi:hypothetical protein
LIVQELHYSSEHARGAFLRWVSTEDEAPERHEAQGLHGALEQHGFLDVVLGLLHEARYVVRVQDAILSWAPPVLDAIAPLEPRGFGALSQAVTRCGLPAPDATVPPESRESAPLAQDAIQCAPPE